MDKTISIKNITWNRIYLLIELDITDNDTSVFYIKNADSQERYPLACSDKQIVINITNVTEIYGNEMLPSGRWHICDSSMIPLSLSLSAAKKLSESDKIFPYQNGAYAYTVNFEPFEIQEDTKLSLIMNTAFMRKNPKPKKEFISLESTSKKEYLTKAVTLALEKFYKGLYTICYKLRPKDGRHVMLMSETKNAASGNLLSLENRLKKRGLNDKFKISHSFHETLNMPYSRVAFYWFRLMIDLAKQDFIFIDDYAPVFKMIRPGQKTDLIQLWHAGVGFKSVGYARFGKQDSPRPLVSAHRNYDKIVVGSNALIPVYQEVFGLSADKFFPYGLPRIDDFLNEKHIMDFKKSFYANYPSFNEKKIILFAPTYRGSGQKEAYYPYEKLDLKHLYDFCDNEYIFAFKMHPFVRNKVHIPKEYSSRIIDLSVENTNDILHITDVLISDYSSVIYEFSLLDRPMLFFAYDKEYYDLMRGFHWDYDKYAPGKICSTFDELMDALSNKAYQTEKIQTFKKFAYEYTDANSCDRIIDSLLLDH